VDDPAQMRIVSPFEGAGVGVEGGRVIFSILE